MKKTLLEASLFAIAVLVGISLVQLLSGCSPAYADPTPGPGGSCAPGKICRAVRFVATDTTTGPALQCSLSDGKYVIKNGTGWGIWTNSSGGQMNFDVAGGTTALNINASNVSSNFSIISAQNGAAAFKSSGTGWWEVKGDTAVNIASQVPTAGTGAINYDTSSSVMRYYRGLAWLQIGGGLQWASEKRTLTINAFHEQSYCPRCTECSGTTATAFDGQTCVDAAAAGTGYIDSISFRTFVTTAAAASVSSWTTRVAETRYDEGPHLAMRGYVASVTSERVWYGLSSVALNASDTPVGNIAAFRFSTAAGDSKWMACTGDGATTTCTAVGPNVAANTSYVLDVDCRPGGATGCLFSVNTVGAAPSVLLKATNLPAATTNLSVRHYCEALAASARTCGLASSALETL